MRRALMPGLRFATVVLTGLAGACGGSDGGTGPGPQEPEPATVLVNPNRATLDALGAQVKFTATVLDDLNRVMPGASVSWSSSDAEVAVIDVTGLATAVGNGAATIVASASSSAFGFGDLAVDAVPLAIKTTSLIPGVAGLSYSLTLEAEGVATASWTVTEGSLPPGLTLNGTTGVLGGTPTTVGTFDFTVTLSSAGHEVSRSYSLLIVSGALGLTFDDDQFVTIPAGSFQMGSEEGDPDESPVHTVTLTRPFQIQKTELTQHQWETVMGTNNTAFPTCGITCPMDGLSWEQAQAFVQALNALYPGKHYRLPTEAEWEYAARAGTTGPYGGTGVVDEMGWYKGNSAGRLRPVALKTPNHWGLYDMHGNAREWIRDYYSAGYYGVSPNEDPQGPETGTYRVTRGGAVDSQAMLLRSASRTFGWPDRNASLTTLRLVRDG